MNYAVTRRLEFDAAHRVLGHQGKCRHLHGHRYSIEVMVEDKELDSLGMVVDFSDIKTILGRWIDENLDHNVILNGDDFLVELLRESKLERDPFVMDDNPTAENIAKLIFDQAKNLLEHLSIVNVRVFETPNCWADYNEPATSRKAGKRVLPRRG